MEQVSVRESYLIPVLQEVIDDIPDFYLCILLPLMQLQFKVWIWYMHLMDSQPQVRLIPSHLAHINGLAYTEMCL